MLAAIIGAAFGIIQMIFMAPYIANIAFKFGPQEICSLMLLGLLAGSTLAKGSPIKGVAMTLFGILLSLVGTDVNTGSERFTFGLLELSDGMQLVAVSLGLFGIAEFLKSVNSINPTVKAVKLGYRDLRPLFGAVQLWPGTGCGHRHRWDGAAACHFADGPRENPGIQLGIALGVAARSLGRDEVTLVTSPGIAPIGAWLEQLLAESTGKRNLGLIPVAGEPLGAPDVYGDDRVFAYIELAGAHSASQRQALAALAAAGHPVIKLPLNAPGDIGQEFFRWEIAVAAAGSIIGINPFDQPDVEASKQKTKALTDAIEQGQAVPAQTPLCADGGMALYADRANAALLGDRSSIASCLKYHFARIKPGDYVALLAYIDRTDAANDLLTALRVQIRDRTRSATCVGFGPRFQHSTGQLYKGGPNTGVFVQITCDDARDLPVPGHRYRACAGQGGQAAGAHCVP
eukprot:gene27309-35271_t